MLEATIKAIDNKELDVAKAELEIDKCIIRIADREDNGCEDEKSTSKARMEALASENNKRKAKKKEQFRNALTKATNFNGTEPDARIGEAGFTLKIELRLIDASCQHAER